MLDLKEVAKFDSGVGSLVEDYAFLYGWVCLLRPKRIAEVGTNHGISAIVMARAMADCDEEGSVFTVDVDPEALAVARRQISESGLSERIVVAQGDVSALPTGDFDFAFIDGNHSYPYVRHDLKELHPRCKVVLLHDAVQCPDVRRAADEFGGQRLFVSPPPGRQFSRGQVVARTSPGWYILFP